MPSRRTPDPKPAKAKKSRRSKAALRTRGPKGYFGGSRKDFLDTQLPEYVAGKKGTRQKFWHGLYATWWQRFPWKLADDEEPPTDVLAMERLALVAPGEEALKKEVEQKLTGRLTRWFSNHASDEPGGLGWLPLLQRLHQLRNPCPRQRSAVQQFMLDHADTVDTAFHHRQGDDKKLTGLQKVNARHEVAKALLAGQYSNLKAELNKRATDQHNLEMDEWNLVLEGVTSAEDVALARDTFFDAVHPLIQAIGTYAGCYVSLVAGNPSTSETGKGFFTAVHWWPGDKKSTNDWTQWDEEGFNSGVASPFLKYAGETNDALKGKEDNPLPVVPPSRDVSVNNGTQSADTSPTRIQPPTSTTTLRPGYRPLPTKIKPFTNKRKFEPKARPIKDVENIASESDEDTDCSGDGDSPGESISSDVQKRPKRPRTSRVVTRSSIRTPAPHSGIQDTLDAPSPALTVARPSTATPGADADVDRADISSMDISAITSSTSLTGLKPPNTHVDTMDVDGSSHGDGPYEDSEIPWNRTERIPSATEATIVTEPGSVAGAPSITAVITPPPALMGIIDAAQVPTFLRIHGKGNRQVNIFKYLDEVQDPRFKRVLYHYLNFEINDKSGKAGSLPTAGRPTEISRWTGNARPATLPDMKGGQSFSGFVGSVFTWWTSIQPKWRKFRRDTVSREVRGDWKTLHAARINGLLNVVILVYWWALALEGSGSDDCFRVDYETFADDVAWVFSHLST